MGLGVCILYTSQKCGNHLVIFHDFTGLENLSMNFMTEDSHTPCKWTLLTSLGWREADSVIAKVDTAYWLAIDRTVLLPLLQDVGERQCEVVLGCLQHEVLGVEVHQGVEKNAWRVGAEQSSLPQMFFWHAANYHSWTGKHTHNIILTNKILQVNLG